jgi:glycogen synthase
MAPPSMKILLIGPFPPPYGGVERNLAAIRAFLLRRHLPCAVINVTRHRDTRADEVYHPSGVLSLLAHLWKLPSDVIHVHVGGMLTTRLMALCLLCTFWPGRRTVLTIHSGGYTISPEGRATGRRSVTAWMFRRLDGVIAVNTEIVAFLRRLGVADARIHQIAPHAFVAGETLSETLPEPLGAFAAAHSPLLVSVGGLKPEYDVAAQIDVLARVKRNWPRAGLAVIGSGALEGDLRARAAASPAGADILLCGDVPHAATMRAIAGADVLLRTTLYDGDAISVREALHLGTPVVATDNGMRPRGVTVVPVSDPDGLHQGIESVLAAPRQARATRVTPDESNLDAVLQLYTSLVRPRVRETVPQERQVTP